MSKYLIFTGNLIAKPDYELLNTTSVLDLATAYRSLGLSGGRTYSWFEAQIYAYHDGDLFNTRENWLDPDNLRPEQLWPRAVLRHSKTIERWRKNVWERQSWAQITLEVGDLFGLDRRGCMNKFMRYAETPPTRELDEHLAPRLMFLDFAWRIHEGRMAPIATQ